jgi:tetratricopeptide (TPR) repeat protein
MGAEYNPILRFSTLLLYFILFLPNIKSQGQEEKDFRHFDSITYVLLLEEKWEDLIAEGTQALEKGFDYYYLRTRIGIALYSLEKYRLSADHFEKALKFNSTDPDVLFYLGKCYEWSGLEMEAVHLEKRFPQYYSHRKKLIKHVEVYSGYSFSGSEKKLSETDVDGFENIYGEINRNGDLLFTHAGIMLAPVTGLWWYNAYTFLNLEKNNRFYSGNEQMKNASHFLKQHQYYTNFSIRMKNYWYVKPSFHYIRVSDVLLKASFDPDLNQYAFSESDTAFNNFLFSMKVGKELPKFSPGIAVALSNLNNANQLQGSAILGYYPQGNVNFYSFITLSLLAESGKIMGHAKQKIGIRVSSWCWLEGSVHTGQLKNASDENGFLVHNTGGRVRTRAALSALFPLTQHLQIQLNYSFTSMEDTYIQYTDFNNFVTLPLNYSNNNIMGGIRWKI